jgi:hypothetical protein
MRHKALRWTSVPPASVNADSESPCRRCRMREETAYQNCCKLSEVLLPSNCTSGQGVEFLPGSERLSSQKPGSELSTEDRACFRETDSSSQKTSHLMTRRANFPEDSQTRKSNESNRAGRNTIALPLHREDHLVLSLESLSAAVTQCAPRKTWAPCRGAGASPQFARVCPNQTREHLVALRQRDIVGIPGEAGQISCSSASLGRCCPKWHSLERCREMRAKVHRSRKRCASVVATLQTGAAPP